MHNLRVIGNELVPVYETSTGEKVVYGSELHEVLGAPSVYREWAKRRLTDIDAVENEDFEGVEISTPSGQTKKDHIIKLDTAKEMAMLERNEKGKQVRRYFIAIEKKYKERSISTSELSPELQMFGKLYEVVARQELQQKEQAAKLNQLDNKIDSIKEVVTLNPHGWRKDTAKLISKIALHIGGYEHIKRVREESYKLLEQRMGVSLGTRLTNKRRRMADEGICKSKRDKLNQVDVIADDKKLIEGYVAVIKDMAIKYGLADAEVA